MRKKEKQANSKQTNKRSRAKYECLPEIEALISLANGIPVDYEILLGFEDHFETIRSHYNLSTHFDKKTHEDLLIATGDVMVSDITYYEPVGVAAYKSAVKFSDLDLSMNLRHEAIFWLKFAAYYDTMIRNLKIFITLARKLDAVRKGKIKKSFIQMLDDFGKNKNDKSFELPTIEITVKPMIDSEGKLEIKIPAVFDVLNDINADRLRICEICNQIFWAKKKNSETCQKSCYNTLGQSRYRKKNREEINAKRRENYRRKKERENKDVSI